MDACSGAVDTVLRETTLQDLLRAAEQHELAHGDNPSGETKRPAETSALLQVEGS